MRSQLYSIVYVLSLSLSFFVVSVAVCVCVCLVYLSLVETLLFNIISVLCVTVNFLLDELSTITLNLLTLRVNYLQLSF